MYDLGGKGSKNKSGLTKAVKRKVDQCRGMRDNNRGLKMVKVHNMYTWKCYNEYPLYDKSMQIKNYKNSLHINR